MSRYIVKSLVFFIVLLFSALVFSFSNVSASNNTFYNDDCEYSVDDNFSCDSILVTLTYEESKKNRDYSISDFSYYNVVGVTELTRGIAKTYEESSGLIKNSFKLKRTLKLYLNNCSKQDIIKIIKKLNEEERVYAAEPNYIGNYLTITPNDQYFDDQWGIINANISSAWDITTGNSSINVGIVDSGIDNLHPDLSQNINTELSADFTGGNSPWYVSGYHGTHVAGIVGARGGNSIGVVGVNWNISLVSLKVGDSAPSTDYVVAAVDYARTNNIPILNMSLSVNNTIALSNIIQSYNGLIVCAAGNDWGIDIDTNYIYPASYNFNNILTVGAINNNDVMSNFSNWGKNNVDIFAPGGEFNSTNNDDIASTYPTALNGNIATGYHYLCGTSMAAPFVTGVAALLLSINPNLTATQIKAAIMNSAEIPNVNNINPLEGLCVTDGKLNAYGAVKYVLENYLDRNNIINLNCATTMHSLINNCIENGSIVYKVNIECPKSYKFISNALSPLEMTFYNSSFSELTSITPVMTNNNCTGTIITYLNPGTYYLRVKYVNVTDSGNITTSYQATWPVSLNATFNTNLNILSNLHLTGNNDYHCVVSFNNTFGEKLFKFKLDAGNNATYLEGAIKVYTDSTLTNPLDRYSVNGITYPATSNALENELYVFLPEKGTYYIEITLPRNDYASLQFLVSDVDEMSINYLNTLATSTLTNIFSYKTEASYFKKVDISHKSKIKIELNSNTGCFNSTKLFIFKLNKDPGYDIGVNHYSLSSILQVNLTYDEDSYNTTLILDEGTYYIGYTNNINCSLNLNLRRLINTNVNMDGTLVADPMPNQGYTIGSEVLLNNGSYNNYNITEGFTRCIYLMVDNILLEPNSRLAYDWYSSDDSVAMVTQYGTVLAKSVTSNTNVTIYAILKEDPSVVYRKTFTILNDTLTYSNAPINIYTSMTVGAGVYTPIDLSDEVVPINILQYYSWSISQGGSVDYWGNIYANTTSLGDTLYITGNYIYNSRVKIHINALVVLSLSGYEIEYNPSLWNYSPVQDETNCYSYAFNTQVYPNTNDLVYMQPGFAARPFDLDDPDDFDKLIFYYEVTLEAVVANVQSDSQDVGFTFVPINKYEKCAPGTYKVALVIDNNNDFHWYRQNPDGTWSHKLAIFPATNLDASNNIIYDPETCDKDYGYVNYDDAIMFFQVTPINNFYVSNEPRALNSNILYDIPANGSIEVGMTIDEIEYILGTPTHILAYGLKIFEYQYNDEIYKITYIQNANGQFVAIEVVVL